MNTWLTLEVKKFKCGHDKTAENSILIDTNGKLTRCRICKNVLSRNYAQRKAKRKTEKK